jgi:hypothetical protein
MSSNSPFLDGGNTSNQAAFVGKVKLGSSKSALQFSDVIEPGERVEWYRFRASGSAPKNYGLNLNPVNEGATIEFFAKNGKSVGKRLLKLNPAKADSNPLQNGSISGGAIKDMFKDKTLKQPKAGEYFIKVTRAAGFTERLGFSLMMTPGIDVSAALGGQNIPDVKIPIKLPI